MFLFHWNVALWSDDVELRIFELNLLYEYSAKKQKSTQVASVWGLRPYRI